MRVALLGDSVCPSSATNSCIIITFVFEQAHAMTPHQGAGAGQAIEVYNIRIKMDETLNLLPGRVYPRGYRLKRRPKYKAEDCSPDDRDL